MRSSDWSSDVGSSDLAAIGGFVIGNPKSVLKRTGKGFGKMLKGPKYGKKNYVELLSLLYLIFKLAKTNGMTALETHAEKPADSGLFAQFPSEIGRASCRVIGGRYGWICTVAAY